MDTRDDKGVNGTQSWRPSTMREEAAGGVFEEYLGVNAIGTDELIERVKAGLKYETFDRLQAALGVSAAEMASVIGVPIRTLARRKKQGHFTPEESDRLLRIARLLEAAVDVLGSVEEAVRWMNTTRPAFGNLTPLMRADTEVGTREVESLLGRIAHGVYY